MITIHIIELTNDQQTVEIIAPSVREALNIYAKHNCAFDFRETLEAVYAENSLSKVSYVFQEEMLLLERAPFNNSVYFALWTL